MSASAPRHCWAVLTDAPAGNEPGDPYLAVRCHRRLRGPYTGGGSLLRSIVPELLAVSPDLVASRLTEIIALAPELAPALPMPPRNLSDVASAKERTRFYPAARTQGLAHGITELLADWARAVHPGGVAIAFLELDDADPTDRELVRTLLRRCDPRMLTVIAQTGADPGDLAGPLTAYARRAAAPALALPGPVPGADLAQFFFDSDGTSRDPAVCQAYASLPPGERARRHTERAAELAARREPSLRLGAIAYHLEHGDDPAGAGGDALVEAVTVCFDYGYYAAAMDLALRGRQIIPPDERPGDYLNLTNKVGACLSYLDRGEESFGYFREVRRRSISGDQHMDSSYMIAMLYTRHLAKDAHDEDLALEWANNAIVIADRHPEEKKRVIFGAFMRNARALVELHRGNVAGCLALVNEAIRLTDEGLADSEHALHRSVLVYNRAQIYANLGDHTRSLADYDEVIRRDPDFGDYYFERAAQRRALGQYAEALADYATAIRINPPIYEAHVNRADLLRELEEDTAALADLDYALELQPDHVDSLVNRADLLLAQGDLERAGADIELGLALEPDNVHLLCARGTLLAENGDDEAACASYTAALTLDPGFAAAWANRAAAGYAAGRLQEAAADLDRAIQLEDDPALRANRAMALQDIGEHSRALADLDIAVGAFGDSDPELLYRRGASRYALGDPGGAAADWRAHLAAYGPGDTSPYVAQIQLRSGDLLPHAQEPENVT